MATFVFTGDPRAPGTDPEECGMLGMTFPLNKPVKVDDEGIAAKLRRHTHFTEVKEEAVDEAPAEVDDLQGVSIADLRAMAAERGIDTEGLRKAEIRDMIRLRARLRGE